MRAGVENRRDGAGDGPRHPPLLHRGVRGRLRPRRGSAGSCGAMFSQSVRPSMGGEQLIFAFIVVIIGGLGSVTGSLVGALLVGLVLQLRGVPRPQGGHRRDHGDHGAGAARAPDRALRSRQVSGPARLTPVQAARAAARREAAGASRPLACGWSCSSRGRCCPLDRALVPDPRPRAQDRALRDARRELRRGDRLHRHRLLRPRDVLRVRRLRGGARGGQAGRAHLWPPAAGLPGRDRGLRGGGGRDRRLLAAGQGALLRHDHAGLRGVRAHPRRAVERAHRRRGRALPKLPGVFAAGAPGAFGLRGRARHLLHGARGVPGLLPR